MPKERIRVRMFTCMSFCWTSQNGFRGPPQPCNESFGGKRPRNREVRSSDHRGSKVYLRIRTMTNLHVAHPIPGQEGRAGKPGACSSIECETT